MSWGGNSNFVNSTNPVFYRGNNGFFGYNNNNGNANTNIGARAVVVCGAGLLQITIWEGIFLRKYSNRIASKRDIIPSLIGKTDIIYMVQVI